MNIERVHHLFCQSAPPLSTRASLVYLRRGSRDEPRIVAFFTPVPDEFLTGGDEHAASGRIQSVEGLEGHFLPAVKAVQPSTALCSPHTACSGRLLDFSRLCQALHAKLGLLMEDLLPREITGTAELALATNCKPEVLRADGRHLMIIPCSRVRGRERWYVDALEDNPRLAAAIELVLRSEDGIEQVRANPLTGRVLVHYRRDVPSETIEALLHRVLEFGPLSREEFFFLPSKPPKPSALNHSLKHFLTAEIGCTAVHVLLDGVAWPIKLTAVGLLLLWHGSGQRELSAPAERPYRVWAVANQTR